MIVATSLALHFLAALIFKPEIVICELMLFFFNSSITALLNSISISSVPMVISESEILISSFKKSTLTFTSLSSLSTLEKSQLPLSLSLIVPFSRTSGVSSVIVIALISFVLSPSSTNVVIPSFSIVTLPS